MHLLKSDFVAPQPQKDSDKSRRRITLRGARHGVSAGSNSRWAPSKSHKKDGKHQMSTNGRISPSLSITLWSQTEKNERRFQGLHQLTGGAAVNKGGGIKRC